MSNPLEDRAVRRLVVFSHPNHELTVFGLLQRLKPWIVYLTDGGGEARLAQTRRGLSTIGLLDRARFLDHTEQSFYDAVLDRDAGFYRRVAAQVRESIDRHRPQQVFCDAVELYNPVHDMSVPVVEAALAGTPGVARFEVPLVWQRTGGGESYVVQRVPPSRRARRVELRLTEAETDAKLHARDEIYSLLADQMGPVSCSLPREYVAHEEVLAREEGLGTPAEEVALRYEWRAKRLLERGEIARMITYEGHWRPLANELAAAPVAR
jgi:hypothetical protein